MVSAYGTQGVCTSAREDNDLGEAGNQPPGRPGDPTVTAPEPPRCSSFPGSNYTSGATG
jgi:hypothetical protein